MNAAITTLLDVEAQSGLWRQKVLGYPVWAQLRLEAYHHLLGGSGAAPGGQARAHAARERVRASARDILTKLRYGLRHRDVWVLASSMYRRSEAGAPSRSIFVKHLEEQLGNRLLFLETNPSSAQQHPDGNVIFLDSLREALRGGCARASRLLPQAAAGVFGALGHLGVTGHEVLREALYGNVWRQFGRALVQAGKPRAVFVLCAYNQHVPIQLAVRAANIPLIEVQHGVIHESHPGYIFDPSIEARHVPDHLLVFGRHFGQLLDVRSPYWRGRWSAAGQPWLAAKAQGFGAHEAENLVVLFGQNVPAVQARLKEFALSLRQVCSPETRLLLKPHPAEKNAATAYAGLAERGIEVAAPGADSYELLARCRIALSVYSTIAIEALAFSCKSVVLRSSHWFEDIARFVETGYIQVADHANDVVAALAAWAPAQSRELARSLFGVGETSLDFERLIAELRSGAEGQGGALGRSR